MTELITKTKQEIKTKYLLAVNNLFKTYNEGKHNAVEVLKGINFNVPVGQMVAIMGPSGCGKTTLLNLIGGLDKYSKGSIEITGNDIGSMDDNMLTIYRRDNIGYIFQLFNLFENQTTLENVSLPLLIQKVKPEIAIAKSRMMLQEVGLSDRYYDLPSKLSGGEQQKVAISRALITRPKIVLADEPTGDLDQATSEDIMALFRRMQIENKDMSIIVVTHSEKIAKKCDRIIRIEDGCIVKDEIIVQED